MPPVFRSASRVITWMKQKGLTIIAAPKNVFSRHFAIRDVASFLNSDVPTTEEFRQLFEEYLQGMKPHQIMELQRQMNATDDDFRRKFQHAWMQRTSARRIKDVEAMVHRKRQMPKDKRWEVIYQQLLLQSWEKKYSHEIKRPKDD